MYHFNIICVLTVFISIFNHPAVNGQSSEPEAVGSIGSSFEVSPTGAATFTIPIEVPLGVGGMQPSIGIAYNSQTGNGLAGWGCNISGIPVITRVPKSIYYDGKATGLSYGKDDGFMLNRQRLLLKGPAEDIGEGCIEYCIESDPFTKVILYGGPDSRSSFWFEVQTKDGMKYHFGESTGKQTYRIFDIASGNYIDKHNAWYLDYVEDVYGNYMNYNYEVSNFCPYLQSIIYGKNKQNKILEFTVNFTYEIRPDPIPFWIEGIRGAMEKRLTKIVGKMGNTTFREYVFAYANTDHFSRLTSVTQKNGSGEALKPTTLQWNNLPEFTQECKLPNVSEAGVYPSVPFADQVFAATDMNGDGLCDLVGVFSSIEYNNDGTVSDVTKICTYQASMNNGQLEFSSADIQTIPASFSIGSINHILNGQAIGDSDGDGKKEIFIAAYTGPSPSEAWFYSSRQSASPVAAHPVNGMVIPKFTLADFNNDGKDEIITIERRMATMQGNECRIGFFEKGWLGMNLPLGDSIEYLFTEDFNGDGLIDLMIPTETGYLLYWNQGNTDGTTNPFLLDDFARGSSIKNCKMLRIGDFNGDGLPDFLMNETNKAEWYFALNVGNGNFEKKLACTLELYDQDFTEKDNDKFDCQVFDFDFDGKTDVVITKARYEKDQDISGTWGKFINTHSYWMRSTGFTLVANGQPIISNNEHDAFNKFIVSGDFDGDGRVELINYGSDLYDRNNLFHNDRVWRLYQNPDMIAGSGLLASTTDGFGKETGVTYSTLSEDGLYTKGYGAEYPMIDIALPVPMVKSATTDNGAAGITEVTYKYAGAKGHLEGKGFLGMSSYTVTNVATGEESETGVSRYNLTWYVPEETYTNITIDKKKAQTMLKYRFVRKDGKNYAAFPTIKTEKDLDENTVTSTYTFDDSDGNITRDSTSFGNNMYRVVCYSDYIQAGGLMPDKPKLITTIQKHANDDEQFVRKTSFNYHPEMGYVTQKIENYGTTQELTTNYLQRDIYGICSQWSVSGPGVPNTIYSQQYGDGRFIKEKSTYPESTNISYTHDTWGNILTETDETDPDNKLTNTHIYDDWGRRTSTTFPDGRKIEYSTGWNNDPKKRYYTLTKPTGAPWQKAWYDQTGRKVEVETVGVKGTPVKSTYAFNNKGELSRTETIAGDLTTWEDITYDKRGRIETHKNSSGQDIAYEYGIREIKTIVKTLEGNRTTTKNFDAWGNLKSVSDPGGTVSYTYKSVGRPDTIHAPNASFFITYDEVGNQKTLVDPDAGTFSYTYDAMGRMLTQKDGRNNVQTNVYDELGRIKSATIGDVQTDYTYGASGNNKMRLVNVKTGNNSVDYTYDNFGRPFTETRTIEGEGALDFTYEYNETGQLKTTTYPGQVAVTNKYDAYGNLINVTANSKPVWTLNTTGLTTTSSLAGGNMTTKSIYNTGGLLTNLKTVKGNESIRDFAYEFNGATGNLTSRAGMIGSEEEFFYDGVNRLVSIKHGGTEEVTMEYYPDGTGNIKT